MKHLYRTFLALLLLLSVRLCAQDTISIYFTLGSSKIPMREMGKILAIPDKYELVTLQSVQFIGMADTLGDLKSNMRLSEKRARTVARNCIQFLPKNLPQTVFAMGEKHDGKKRDLNRRVDIVLHFIPSNRESEKLLTTEKAPVIKPEYCYYVDYDLLHRSNIREAKQGKLKIVVIESEEQSLKNGKQHFYASKTKDGIQVTRPLKWTEKTTGLQWWAKRRFIATLPQADFERFRIFTLGEKPCVDCHEDVIHQPTTTQTDTCTQVDYFLMNNLQYRYGYFSDRLVGIRAPREYINLKEKYFRECDRANSIQWQTQRGRRKKHYYFEKLGVRNSYIHNISRVMECCGTAPEPTECNRPIVRVGCLFLSNQGLNVLGETGMIRTPQKWLPYAGMAFNLHGLKADGIALIGIDSDKGLIGEARFQYHFISRPWHLLLNFSGWQSPQDGPRIIYKYARVYAGTTLQTRLNPDNDPMFTQNIHLGLAAVNTQKSVFIPRIYLQSGLGMNYLGGTGKRFFPVVQAGIQFNLANIGPKP